VCKHFMTDILNKTIVLVLNRNWQAINIRTPQDAFCQMATNVTDLIFRVINQASMHFAMKKPPELGAFKWVIDGKDKTKTAYEAAWELLAAGLIQTKGIENPGVAVEEGDYTFFRQSFMRTDATWPAHLPKPRSRAPFERGMIWNLKRVLYESLSFVDSKNCCGLQLIDIVTSIFRRALMGRLQQPGYERLGELMRRFGPSPVEMHLFNSLDSLCGVPEYKNAVALIDSRSQLVGQ
jgi:hypothetical protein